jgi:hypothetical protein
MMTDAIVVSTYLSYSLNASISDSKSIIYARFVVNFALKHLPCLVITCSASLAFYLFYL